MTREIGASSLLLSAMNRHQKRWDVWYKAMEDAGVKGFPIRIRVTPAEKNGGFEMELVRLEKKAVPASLFQVPPPGYTESSRAMTSMSPEQEKRMQEMLSKMTPEQRKAFEDAMKGQQPK